MATLQNDVKTRYSVSVLAALTNPDAPEVTAIDDPRLDLAVADVEGDFLRILGRTYDSTLKEHVSVAVEGVMVKLRLRTGNTGDGVTVQEEKWLERLRGLRLPVIPTSTSRMTPTPETVGSQVKRPAFDDPGFGYFGPTHQGTPPLFDD